MLKTFELKSELVTKVHEEFKKKPDTFRISREDKINLFKEEKTALSELEKVEKENDRLSREIHLRQFDCLNIWLYFPMEKKMMEFREKLEADPDAKRKFEHRHCHKKKEPKPEMKFVNLGPKCPHSKPLYSFTFRTYSKNNWFII